LKRVLITGMSGTGKSTVIRELALRGFKAIDTDYDDLSVFVPPSDELRSPGETGWLWREDRIQELLSTEDSSVLFMSGTHSNQSKFYRQFDHIVLLSAPRELIVERLTTRTNNPYGKRPGQIAEVLGFIEAVEPSLRRAASLEVVTTSPVEQVLEAILAHVSGAPPQSRD
jgi:shikimate kinase